MTAPELFKRITSELKWYEPHYTAQHASILKKRFNDGKLGIMALENMLTKFGYSKTIEQWEKL